MRRVHQEEVLMSEELERFLIQHLHPTSFLSVDEIQTWMSETNDREIRTPSDGILNEMLDSLLERNLVERSERGWRLTPTGKGLRDRYNREDRRKY
jgi:coproporphyrinogen III oxidase-like Fe-S oxidoreductase